jgi:monoterpene epsilon-lactone hydrolase
MASARAHVLSFLLRRFFKPQLAKAKDVMAVRRVMSRPPMVAASGTTIAPIEMGGVKGEKVSPTSATDAGALLYVHGGGFIACSPRTHRSLTCEFARTGFTTFVPDYRLAPEHPFPAGLEDVVAFYGELIRHVDVRRLVLAGESAGAGLVMSLLLTLRDRNIPRPAAAALYSPFADLAATGSSVQRNASRCAMFTPESFVRARELYIGDGDPRAPLVSPVYADLHALPPLLIHVGEDETLLDDSLRLAARAKNAGVDVTIKTWPVVPHAWQLFGRWIPEARQSVAETCDFFARHLGSARNSQTDRGVLDVTLTDPSNVPSSRRSTG